jgi:hypothetical protein
MAREWCCVTICRNFGCLQSQKWPSKDRTGQKFQSRFLVLVKSPIWVQTVD